MLKSAFVRTGHGYETGSQGRCDAFDSYDVLANPLGGFDAPSRASRSFPSKTGGNGTTYDSYALYLLASKDRSRRDREYYVAVHHGSGREIWQIPACFHYYEETVAALIAMPERALYSVLFGIYTALSDTKRAAEESTAATWRRATVDKRVRVSRQPSKGRAFVWIEPERQEGETEAQFNMRCAFAKPSGVK